MIGFFQVLAMWPGTSRSAATIIGGMILGLNRKTAADFSFFLAIPTMLGATLLKIVKAEAISLYQWGLIGLGFVLSFIVAYVVIKKFLDKTHVIKYIYSLLLIIIGFLIFNSNSVNEIFSSLKNMFMLSNIPMVDDITLFYFKNYMVLFISSIVLATPLVKVIVDKLKNTKVKGIVEVMEMVIIMALLVLCVSFLIDASFNPFLYFRF